MRLGDDLEDRQPLRNVEFRVTMPESDDFAAELLGEVAPQPSDKLNEPVSRPQERADNETTQHRLDYFKRPSHETPPLKSRWMTVLKWAAGIVATVVAGVLTTGIVWIISVSVSTASKVDVLLDRPPPVPLSQYQEDMSDLKRDVDEIDQRVSDIERKQLEQRYPNSDGPR